MFDPATFGTPLSLLQMPPETIKDVHHQLQQPSQNIVQYTQDCKRILDLKPVVSEQDFKYAQKAVIDVGYICRKCQMVYPDKEACQTHLQTICYAGVEKANIPSTAKVKLEQIQFECSLCEQKMSTLTEYKEHCETAMHNAANAKRSMGGFIASSYDDEAEQSDHSSSKS